MILFVFYCVVNLCILTDKSPKMAIFEGSFERVCVQNFSAYLDKIGVSEAKKKIALNANLFRQIITFQKEQQIVKIVTQIQYGVDLGLTTTETWYSIQNLNPLLTFLKFKDVEMVKSIHQYFRFS